MSNQASPKCPQCGSPLPENAPAGLCPHCLMALNLKTETVFTDDAPAAQPPLPPEQIAPHFPQLEILECLGRGGMGVVYKARQKTLNRFVALKLLAPERVQDVKFAERFAREAQSLAALNHPNIVTIHDFGQAGGYYYLLMEFVDGANLRQLLRAKKFTPEEALAIVPPLCDALQYAHERGIIHRDIKPENLLLDKAGRVKVADFGIAKMIEPESGRVDLAVSPDIEAAQQPGPTGMIGTPGYSAPEQKTDPQRVDSRADIYSLGVVFYEMLTGELPGKKIDAPSKKVHIDVRLDEIVLRALEKKPELRYQQVSDVKTMVETIVATPRPGSSRREEAQTEKTESRKQKAEIESHFSRLTIVLVVFVAIIGATAALIAARSHYTTSAKVLSQSDFLNKFQSNEIARATIILGGQNSSLTPITGTFFKIDKDGKLTKEEVPFSAPNVFLTQKMLDELMLSDKVNTGAPNVMLMNLVWSVVPFIILAVGGLLIFGIVIYIVWRAVNELSATQQKTNTTMNSKLKNIMGYALVIVAFAACLVAAWFYLQKPKTKHPLLPGLVASWPADGNANAVGGDFNGTLSASGATFAPGKVGMGFRFDGTNGSVQIPDSPALKPANVTAEAWVWLDPSAPPDHGGEAIIFKKNTWSAFFEGYSLIKDHIDNADGTGTDRFSFVISNHGKQVILRSTTVAQRGIWYHVAGTYDGSKSTLWVNGVAEDSATPGFALDYDTTPVYIGTSGTWAPYLCMFSGIINEPSIYNRALSADEIKQIYNAAK